MTNPERAPDGGPQGPAQNLGEWLGRVLVALQFGLLLGLVWQALQSGRIPLPAWMLAAASVALGVWALRANPPGNINIRPTPHPQGRLVLAGPYRWIRHPMYTAVLLGGTACAVAGNGLVGWLALGLLAAVLFGKSVLEERWMVRQHPGYGAYRAGTARFVPGLF
jgi:protein-S-isoprenylcysteine O-methyltransferase Ste14